MKTEPSRQRRRIPSIGLLSRILAFTAGVASAQDPVALSKARDDYRAKCEAAGKDYTSALRSLHDSMKAAGNTEAAAVVAKELAEAEAALPLGTVRYLTSDPPKDIGASTKITVHSLDRHPGQEAGFGSKAIVSSVNLPLGQLALAADYSSKLARTPDLVRFDFTGEENFTDENTIPIDPKADPGYARFGPKILQVARDGKTIPVNVFGVLRYSPSNSMIELGVGPVVEATCLFGDKTHRVRLADCEGRLDFVRGTPLVEKGRRRADGSRLLIDAEGTGTFGVKGEYGQPIRVDGQWYDIALDGQTMSAWPLDLASAAITFPKGTLACSLAGKSYAFRFSDTWPIDVIPAGDYAILEYYLHSSSKSGWDTGWLAARGAVDENGTPKLMGFPPDKVTDVPIGEPLTARVAAKRNAEGILLSLEVTDRGGGKINLMRLPTQIGREWRSLGDSRPAPAKVTVEGVNGKAVYQALLRYGDSRSGHPESIACSELWQPPPALKGRFTINVEFEAEPFRTKTESTELLIE